MAPCVAGSLVGIHDEEWNALLRQVVADGEPGLAAADDEGVHVLTFSITHEANVRARAGIGNTQNYA